MNKKVWSIILTVALIGIVGSLGFIAWNLYTDMKGQEVYEETQSIVTKVVTATPTPQPTEADDSSLTVEKIEQEEFTGVRDGEAPTLPDGVFSGLGNPINFDVLHDITPDIYAWIRISEIGIDLPIARNPADDYYYLDHDMYGNVNRVGCPFTMSYNSLDFSDPNTVIYGHNMETGTMFAPLHTYEDKDFFDNHEFVYIYTPDTIRIYQIFSARYYDDRDLMLSFDFNDKAVYQSFLDEIFEIRDIWRYVRDGVEVTTDDRIITLSTCISGQPENRFLVHAKLVWEGSEDQLAAAQAETEAQSAVAVAEQGAPEEAVAIPEATE